LAVHNEGSILSSFEHGFENLVIALSSLLEVIDALPHVLFLLAKTPVIDGFVEYLLNNLIYCHGFYDLVLLLLLGYHES